MDKFHKFLKEFPILKFKKGTVIVSQGEIPRMAFVVQTGIVKTYNLSADGDEKLVDFMIENNIFPDSWVFGKSLAALYFYEALTDSNVYVIPRPKLGEFINDNHDIQIMIMDQYISSYIAQTLRINALANSHSTAKLLHTLRYLCLRFGLPNIKDPNSMELAIYLTHEQFSKLVGLSRETTTKTLIQLRDKKILIYKTGKIVVDLDKLSDAIGDTDFEGLDFEKKLELTN